MGQSNVVIIDNHDSFTGNLFQLFDQNPACRVQVVSIGDLRLEQIKDFDKIVISPGPDIPQKYPKLSELFELFKTTKSILGVCLGHQALAEFLGGKLFNLPQVFHGKKEAIHVNTSEMLFKGLPEQIEVGLYHSWAVDRESLPRELRITAESKNGVIMGIAHQKFDCIGIQFHPESYMTYSGSKIIDNWLKRG